MGRPKNKEEYRAEMAETFAHILEEKGLAWRKEWNGKGGGAPHNGVTKANYRGCNAFWLSLIAMSKGYTDPRWVTMHQIMDPDKKYHPNEKWHLKKGTKATYVEYWYPYDVSNKKAMTWDEYRDDIANGRSEKEFTLATRYTAVFNAHEVEGMPELQVEQHPEIAMDELVQKLSEGMGVEILLDGGDRAYYSPSQDKIHLPTPESFHSEYVFLPIELESAHAPGLKKAIIHRLDRGCPIQLFLAFPEAAGEFHLRIIIQPHGANLLIFPEYRLVFGVILLYPFTGGMPSPPIRQ